MRRRGGSFAHFSFLIFHFSFVRGKRKKQTKNRSNRAVFGLDSRRSEADQLDLEANRHSLTLLAHCLKSWYTNNNT